MNIKELRTKEGLSQSALAKKLGIATSAIGHMENGRMKVSAKIADKAKAVFGVVLDTEAKVEKAAKINCQESGESCKEGTCKSQSRRQEGRRQGCR
jgi:Helix-turn-helix.